MFPTMFPNGNTKSADFYIVFNISKQSYKYEQ